VLNGGADIDRCDGGVSAGDISLACESKLNVP
jgi:hypothetical protein